MAVDNGFLAKFEQQFEMSDGETLFFSDLRVPNRETGRLALQIIAERLPRLTGIHLNFGWTLTDEYFRLLLKGFCSC